MEYLQTNSKENNVNNLCRCCLQNVFSNICSSKDWHLYESMFRDTFGNELIANKEYNEFSYTICNECVKKIREANQFKIQVLNNEHLFYENLQRISTENGKDIELEKEIKTEGNSDLKTIDYAEDSHEDSEFLADLKLEINNSMVLKKKCSKKKTIDGDTAKSKLLERRGNGPLLRENSLKLLSNSSLCVFQWNRSRYCCFCCKKPFTDFSLLKQHTTTHSLEEIKKIIIIQQNRLVKVEITDLFCKICAEKVEDLSILKRHLDIEHDVSINDHLLVPFKIGTELKCQICTAKFDLFRLLNIHVNKHYQNHVCHVCGAGFSNLVFLNLHKSRSHRDFKCANCNVSFTNKNEKRKHDFEVHGVKNVRKPRFPCQFCPERFFQENLKVLHLVQHHGLERPEFTCNICSKVYVTRSLLNNHVKIVHKKEKIHECNVCHSYFYRKFEMLRHKATHSEEKKFNCMLCSNLFSSKYSMRRHMKRSHNSV